LFLIIMIINNLYNIMYFNISNGKYIKTIKNVV
jgi:hypothetical protein